MGLETTLNWEGVEEVKDVVRISKTVGRGGVLKGGEERQRQRQEE